MKRNKKTDGLIRRAIPILSDAVGKKCWHVTAGGITAPQFSVALGRKIRRDRPLRTPQGSKAFQFYEGEISFFIRCSWRLESEKLVIASSDDAEKPVVLGLRRLAGKTLVDVKVEQPAWDLILGFSGGLRLHVFCDVTNNSAIYLKNWHARVGDTHVYAGPGINLNVEKGLLKGKRVALRNQV